MLDLAGSLTNVGDLMANPIRQLFDFAAKKKIKASLLATVRQRELESRGKAGAQLGVEVPRGPLYAAAVMELLREHPEELLLTRWRDGLMLQKRRAFMSAIGDELKRTMEITDTIVHPEDSIDDL